MALLKPEVLLPLELKRFLVLVVVVAINLEFGWCGCSFFFFLLGNLTRPASRPLSPAGLGGAADLSRIPFCKVFKP